MELKNYVRDVIDFPTPWINFKDITPLLQSPEAFQKTVNDFSQFLNNVDAIVWLDARWFIFAWALAYKLGKPLIIIRKKGKLPHKTVSVDYELEYWKNTFDIHIDAIQPWQKIAIIDDVLATGGTAIAACHLVEKLGWEVDSINFLIDLTFLNWWKKLHKYKINSLLKY